MFKRPPSSQTASTLAINSRTKSREPGFIAGSHSDRELSGRWKTLFGICHEIYPGEIKQLTEIVRVTIVITNIPIHHHPLRQPEEEMIYGSGNDCGAPAIELDESSGDSEAIKTSKIES
jgi:hypothetical protein